MMVVAVVAVVVVVVVVVVVRAESLIPIHHSIGENPCPLLCSSSVAREGTCSSSAGRRCRCGFRREEELQSKQRMDCIPGGCR
jgi:hypothetical protein